jgi:hypothetical protein
LSCRSMIRECAPSTEVGSRCWSKLRRAIRRTRGNR